MVASLTNSGLRLLLLLLLLTTEAAWARPSKEFDQHVAAATRYVGTAENDKAIEEFNAAYRINPAPYLLVNIGRCHMKADRPKEALAVYRQVLDMKLDREEREELNKSITTATLRLAEKQQQSMQLAPTSALGTTAGPAPLLDVRSVKPPEQPLYKKAWFWGILGGVAAAGIVTGIVVGLHPWENSTSPRPGSTDTVLQ